MIRAQLIVYIYHLLLVWKAFQKRQTQDLGLTLLSYPTRWSLLFVLGLLWWSYFSIQATEKYSTAMYKSDPELCSFFVGREPSLCLVTGFQCKHNWYSKKPGAKFNLSVEKSTDGEIICTPPWLTLILSFTICLLLIWGASIDAIRCVLCLRIAGWAKSGQKGLNWAPTN